MGRLRMSAARPTQERAPTRRRRLLPRRKNTLAADRRASNPNWEPGPSRRAAGSWPKESRRAGHRYRIGSLPRSTRCGLPFALKPVGYLLHASRGLDLADPLAWPGGRGERHRKRCRRGPLLRGLHVCSRAWSDAGLRACSAARPRPKRAGDHTDRGQSRRGAASRHSIPIASRRARRSRRRRSFAIQRSPSVA
jgi:hypothetical protein